MAYPLRTAQFAGRWCLAATTTPTSPTATATTTRNAASAAIPRSLKAATIAGSSTNLTSVEATAGPVQSAAATANLKTVPMQICTMMRISISAPFAIGRMTTSGLTVNAAFADIYKVNRKRIKIKARASLFGEPGFLRSRPRRPVRRGAQPPPSFSHLSLGKGGPGRIGAQQHHGAAKGKT